MARLQQGKVSSTFPSVLPDVMTILSRHIGLSLLRGYFPVFLLLLAVFSLIVLVDEIDEVGKGQYTFLGATEFLALTMPSRLVFLAPFIALLGSILALGGLANGRELIAMQASGVSPYQIAGAVMKYGLVLIVGVALMEQFVTPPLDQQAFFDRSLALSESKTFQSQQGFWFKDGRRYVRIHNMLYGTIPQGIDIFEFHDDGQMARYLHAQEANIDNPQKWLLKQVKKKIIHGQAFSKEYVEEMEWDSPLQQEEMRVLTLPTSSLSPSDLYRYVKVLERNGQNSVRYELAFWEKVFRPLNAGLMILVAIPFAFGPFRAATTGKRILMGSITGLGYYLIAKVIEQVGAMMGLPPVWTMIAPFASLLGVTVLFWRKFL
ncbi:MAG: LPS export ABC transporter permease LptG [Nitrospirota bacterium]|nr:LPS export ABC transporter permease LptG [Nitrospirota bacterium]